MYESCTVRLLRLLDLLVDGVLLIVVRGDDADRVGTRRGDQHDNRLNQVAHALDFQVVLVRVALGDVQVEDQVRSQQLQALLGRVTRRILQQVVVEREVRVLADLRMHTILQIQHPH